MHHESDCKWQVTIKSCDRSKEVLLYFECNDKYMYAGKVNMSCFYAIPWACRGTYEFPGKQSPSGPRRPQWVADGCRGPEDVLLLELCLLLAQLISLVIQILVTPWNSCAIDSYWTPLDKRENQPRPCLLQEAHISASLCVCRSLWESTPLADTSKVVSVARQTAVVPSWNVHAVGLVSNIFHHDSSFPDYYIICNGCLRVCVCARESFISASRSRQNFRKGPCCEMYLYTF